MQYPKPQTALTRPYDFAQTTGRRRKLGVSQDPANKTSCFVLSDGQHYDAIPGVAQPPVIEPEVTGEECHGAKPVQ
ncbi:MAG TPA: hypothetical protein VMH22_13505 [bacterium]|nr:hypothetical protein [bacterium]